MIPVTGSIVRPVTGLVPGVKLTLVPIAAADPFVVSSPITDAVVPPLVPDTGPKLSSTASMLILLTVTLSVLEVTPSVVAVAVLVTEPAVTSPGCTV